MDITHLDNAAPFDAEKVSAKVFLKGGRTTAITIRLSPGQVMPGHNHGDSELMLYAVEGLATLDVGEGAIEFPAGSLAHLVGNETLTIANPGSGGVTLLAILAR